jgi:hypothetical protein
MSAGLSVLDSLLDEIIFFWLVSYRVQVCAVSIGHRGIGMVGGPRKYHLAALRRGEWPDPWIWEIFHRGKSFSVRIWDGYFRSYSAAMRAGRPEFDQFLVLSQKEEGE